ncbi:hypothetical protein GX865_04225 [Candidatus Saccharibacteria bacterium]|jgi:hypothetical protein|nr:hypothetical protein [Candidatus Saccharibacteria bacterium]
MIENILQKTHLLVAGLAVFMLFAAITAPSPVMAQASQEILSGASATGQDGGPEVQSSIQTITNILLFILGFVAVIAIVIGGIMYAVSGGDAGKTKAAKDTILYAVIGLVVAILAYAIVSFIAGSFEGGF